MIAAIASGVIPYCCGDMMTVLKANTTDGKTEKHLPVATFNSDKTINIKIGTVPHPMTREHNIRFVCLETSVECIVRHLNPEDPPEVNLKFNGKPIAVYAYCNLHGLWRTEISEAACKTSKA